MKRILSLLVAACLVGACSVKDKPGAVEPIVDRGNLPEGVRWTSDRAYLVYMENDVKNFKVGEMKSVYRIVSADLAPAKVDLSVKYLMPEMPEMPVVPAKITREHPGEFSVTYDISMGGTWKFDLSTASPTGVVDTLTFEFKVLEE